MSAKWFNVLVVLTCLSFVNSKLDLDTPVSTARCRATCLFKMQISRQTDVECQRSFNCSQCWRACVAVKTPLCAVTDCSPGSTGHISPVPLEEVLVVNDSRASWPRVSGPVVYVVMADGAQLCQTLETSVALPSTADPTTVRVLVVAWRGLVKVFAPVAASPVEQALHILRSLGMEDKPFLELRGNSHVEGLPSSSVVPKSVFHRVWTLKLESVRHQPPLVMGKVSWRHYHHQLLKGNRLSSYLVTWLVDGGVIKGNLLTNTSTVTLSLLPDTLYRIQVTMLNQESSNVHSELLVLDTHRLYAKPNNSLASFGRDHIPSERGLIIPQTLDRVTTIILAFLGLIVVLAWRWQYRHFLSKKTQIYERIPFTKL